MEFIKLQKEADFKASFTKEHIATFLHQHLEQYGDPVADIIECINYVETRGGFVGLALVNHQIIGAVIINETGMKGYIPENILVYIAVDSKVRGEGVGKKLMQFALKEAQGDVALHVEANNPAKFLYEKLGFTNPYLEMRLKR